MALADYLLNTINQYEAQVLAIDNEEVTQLAKKIAYYSAMIDAALDDPLDDDALQEETLAYLRKVHTEHVESYQILVNEHV